MSWLILIIALFMPSMVDAACVKAATTFTCSGADVIDSLRLLYNSDVPSAILEGDTVSIPAGTYVWNHQLVSGEPTLGTFKSIPGHTFVGAGQGVTIFQRGPSYVEGSFGGMLVFETLASSGITDISGFTLDMQSTAGLPTQGSLVVLGSGLDKFRVHHVTIDNLKSKGFVSYGNRPSTAGLEFSGLFDHNTCNGTTTGSVTCFYNRPNTNQKQYLFPITLGSNHSTYFEDNTCNVANVADACIDTWMGGSTVFRFNTSSYNIGFHGADSGLRGPRQLEIYRNKFGAPGATQSVAMNFRGGPTLVFDNAFTSSTFTWPTSLTMTLQRSVGTYGAVGICNGSNTYDGNLGTGSVPVNGTQSDGNKGWPCLDQTGWNFPSVSPDGAHAVYYPAYIWNNTRNAVQMTVSKNDQPVPSCSPSCGTWTSTYVVADRDYYAGSFAVQTTSSSPFDGTTGVGYGTLARRPATCTTNTTVNAQAATLGGGTGGVGYWATDQGSWNTSGSDSSFNPSGVAGEDGIFYKCTATNTWTTYFTPYAYPHPLQGSAPAIPSAPTGLRTLTGGAAHTCTIVWTASALNGQLGYHLYSGSSSGVYDRVVDWTPAIAAAAHMPPTQYTFRFSSSGTKYITITAYSADVADTAAATEVTCSATVSARSASGSRGGH